MQGQTQMQSMCRKTEDTVLPRGGFRGGKRGANAPPPLLAASNVFSHT